jgi:hypothetical protein
MLTWVSLRVRAAGRAIMRGSAVLAGAAILAGGVLATPVSGTTDPQPTAGLVPGVSTLATAGQDSIRIFYQQASHSLATIYGPAASEWGQPQNLGGVLTSGASAITIKGPVEEFASTSVFVRGTDQAVWYRAFSDARGTWGPWTSLGGRAIGTPGVICVATGRYPAVFVRGTDDALWRRDLSGDPSGSKWFSFGGRLASAPAALQVAAGTCPPGGPIVFALGTDDAIWELDQVWHRVGGQSTVAPAAVQLPSGEIDLFARGTDNALWMNVLAPGATAWRGWHQVGGILTSAPAAGIWPFSLAPPSLSMVALGADGNLWIGHNAIGTATWDWAQVP